MTSALTTRGSTRAWRALRALWTPLVTADLVTCWRCGHPIRPGQPWDLGHRTDRAAGGSDGDARPEHRHATSTCEGNRSAGARAGNARRRDFSEPIAPRT
ncbi:MAG TPA: hypothetical protein VH395_14395, partial [Jatrophihabitantaceae bacterium]